MFFGPDPATAGSNQAARVIRKDLRVTRTAHREHECRQQPRAVTPASAVEDQGVVLTRRTPVTCSRRARRSRCNRPAVITDSKTPPVPPNQLHESKVKESWSQAVGHGDLVSMVFYGTTEAVSTQHTG